jgi:hypothetical protein
MSLTKRHLGRRVAGVVTGVALLLLGLEAPASAAVTITAITPSSGPDDCVTVLTGTGFEDFPEDQMDVDFINAGDASSPNAADFLVIDATTIWALVPAGTDPGFAYTVRVTNPANAPTGVTSTATFLNTAGSGACAPTITSFTACASAGDVVVITGTNLINAAFEGAEVRFSPYAAAQIADHTVPDVDDVTSLSVVVPTGSGDGPIQVTTDVGSSVFSATNFLTPPPDCVAPTGHTRAITLSLKKNGKASGVVSSTETTPFTDCVKAVPVKIQRKAKGGWKNAGSATTSDTGSYSHKTKGKPGKYRAIASPTSAGTPPTDCLKAKSATRTIK